MRSVFYYFLTTLLLVGSFTGLQAQDDDEHDGYGGHWFLGLSGGAAWQQSDVRTQLGGGWSFYLGKNILYSPTAPLSLDLRFRYLGTQTFGQDFQTTDISNNPILNGSSAFSLDAPDYSGSPSDSIGGQGFVFHNHRTGFNDLSLEARVNFENLRRKANIWLSLYGGIGVGFYRVKYDQLDERNFGFEQEYHDLYRNVNNRLLNDASYSEDQAISDLLTGRDLEYDTWMDGSTFGDYSATLTPSVGIELGYWITPKFALGVGHRATWTLQDDFDGVRSDRGSPGGASNNIHHYANLFAHFRLNDTKPKEPVRPLPPPRVDPPTVDITTPGSSPSTVAVTPTPIRATIRNVSSSANVRLYVNGSSVSGFSYNSSTDVFTASVNLNPGANTVKVTGTNSAGTAQDQVTIFLQGQTITDPKNPPVVDITTPAANPTTTNTPSANIRATIRNVNSSNNVTFTVNGQNVRNFNFSGTSFSANNIALQQGNNTVRITGSNNDGTASDQTVIIYNQPQQQNPPTVRITTPSADPFTTQNPSQTIRATITNVASSNNVTFTVNNQNNRNFSFSGTSFVASNVSLQPGNNTIRITGSNNDGTASDQTVIIYNQPQKNPPTVNITVPSGNPYNTQSPTETIRATITNVASSNNVTFTVNNQNSRNFSFSGTSFVASNVGLQPGNNTIRITGSNNDGTASDQTVIIYNQPQKNPPTVNITVPSGNPYNTQSPTETIRATITNVASSNNVTFTVNNQNSRNFSFSGTSFVASNVSLQPGNNTIRITGSNNDGTASDQTVIIYNQPQKNPPTVNITVPSGNPYNTQNPTESIRATITNVASSNNVTFTINNQNSRNFSFSGTSFVASNVGLQPGNNTIRITGSNNDGTASDQTVIIYNPPQKNPPTVKITVPSGNPYNTQNASETIRATITNVASSNNVTFTVNNQNNRSFSFSGTSFVASNVNLQPGNNTIRITGSNNDGTASDQTVIIYRPVQKNPPTVNITVPSGNPYNTQNPTETIRATITNVTSSNNVTFTVNNQSIRNFSFSGTSFVATNIALQQGNNTIRITGSNNDGTASDQTVIIYTPVQKNPPTVNITVPSSDPYNTGNATETVRATITNVSSKNDVTFTINGQNNSNFSLAGTSFTATNVGLQQGNNTIKITGRNNDGTASDQTVIIYRPIQKNPPTVNIVVPNSDPYNTGNATETVRATITNVSSKNDVTFTINGQNNSNFSLAGTTFTATNVGLQQGNNTIKITGRNNDGTASDQTVIIYRPIQKNPPTVNIVIPNANPYNTQNSSETIRATITNVSSSSGVTFQVNGQTRTNFSLNGTTFTATNVGLQQGNNTIKIIGRNNDGTASDQTVIVYKPATPPPTVNITNPSANPHNTTTDKHTIIATITNVANANNVTFKVNNQSNRNFTLSGTTFRAPNVQLRQGNNTIVITGSNSNGTASDQTVIVYNPPLPPPVVTITMPARNPYTSSSAQTTIRATILNVSSKNDVTFVVNGQNNAGFSFSGTSFTASNVALNAGNNTISITGRNSVGTDSKTTVVVYNPPQPPDVRNTNVSIKPNNGKCIANITAEVLHVSGLNNINFTVNGQRKTSGINFRGTSFQATVDVTNLKGNITFKIVGTNSDGTDSETKVANTSACGSTTIGNNGNTGTIGNNNGNQGSTTVKPTVNFTAPRLGRSNSATTNVIATVTSVNSKSQVTFKVNGSTVSNFTMSGVTFRANNVTLNQGTNVLEITATNSAGTARKTYNVTYTPSGGSNGGADRPGGGGKSGGDDNDNNGTKGNKMNKTGGNTDAPQPSKGNKMKKGGG